jgi:hypothetical protein
LRSSGTGGLLVSSYSANGANSGAGLTLLSNNNSFLVGFAIPNTTPKTVLNESFRDDGTAAYSIHIINAHSSRAIVTESGAGPIHSADQIGTGGPVYINGCHYKSGTGSPNGSAVGSPCDVYANKSGGAGTTLYVKESGSTTNTGWVGK